MLFFFSSRRRHTRYWRDWSSDVCSSDLGLVAAEGRGESLAATKEIDSAGLAIVLGEDAAVMALINGDAIPGDSSFINNFFPAELVGVPLRQRGPGVRVFHDRKLEREIFCVGEEAVRPKNRYYHWRQVCAAG